MMRQTRRWLMRAVLVVVGMIALGGPSLARAEHWTYTQDTLQVLKPATGGLFTFAPPVATGMPQYNWQYGITEIYLQLGGQPPWEPYGLARSGGPGSATGLPFSLGQDLTIHEVNAFPHADDLVIDFTIKQYVDVSGAGHLDITGITWGVFWLGPIRYDVTGVAVAGSTDVVAVPEPAGILMLLSGAGMLGLVTVWRRRR